MKLVLPREHGAWGMLFAPLLAGIVIGGFEKEHLLLVGGMLAAYLSAYPLLQWVKQPREKAKMFGWALGYGTAAVLLGLPLLLKYPQLISLVIAATMVLLINIDFALRRKERHIVNDFAAICGLALGAVAAYFVGRQSYDQTAWLVWMLFVVHFFGSVLYVKSLIREKNNPVIRHAAWIYQALAVLLPLGAAVWFAGAVPVAGISLAFLFSAVKVWTRPLYGKRIRPLGIGMIEIANTVWFVSIVSWLFL